MPTGVLETKDTSLYMQSLLGGKSKRLVPLQELVSLQMIWNDKGLFGVPYHFSCLLF